jgi:predicted nucleic acid-binding Zn ribbon protein
MKKGISTKAPRTCRECGAIFDGGPRAWYCLACRETRKKLQKARYVERRKRGLSITLGESVGKCEVCGKDFVYAAARQRYCSDCAQEAWKKSDSQQGLVWYYANDTEERRKAKSQRQKERRNGRKGKQRDLDLLVAWKSLTKKRAVKDCIVCGKEISNRRRHYCSEKCRMIGAAYATTLSHYLAGDIRSCPTWDEWVERHME